MPTGTVQLSAAAEIEALGQTILLTDCVAQARLAAISSIAQLALVALGQQKSLVDTRTWDVVAQALTTISDDAEDLMDHINGMAEKVGCNHVERANSQEAVQ